MELNELVKNANSLLSLSECLEGKELKKAVIDLVLAMAEEAVKLRRRSLNCEIETKRLKAKYERLKSKLEDFKEYDKEDRSKDTSKQQVKYTTSFLKPVKEFASELETFVKEIYDVASKAANDKSTSVVVTCVKAVFVIGGVLSAVFAPGGKVVLFSCLLSAAGGAGSLLGQGYNSYCCRAQESKLVKLAAEADEFLAIIVKMKTKLELKAVSLEVEKEKVN